MPPLRHLEAKNRSRTSAYQCPAMSSEVPAIESLISSMEEIPVLDLGGQPPTLGRPDSISRGGLPCGKCRINSGDNLTQVVAVIFDLDGTLIDSAGDLQAAANRVLNRLHMHIAQDWPVCRSPLASWVTAEAAEDAVGSRAVTFRRACHHRSS